MPEVRFAVLGPLRVRLNGAQLALGPRQQRAVLAMLLVNAGQPVLVSDLVDALWPDKAPRSAVNVIHRYVGQLRRLLEPELPPRAEGQWILRSGGAYRLHVDSESADITRFRALIEQARAADGREAVRLFVQALGLWRGRCASSERLDTKADALYAGVDQECLAALVEAADVALANHMAAEILPEFRRIAPYDPLNEVLYARLMVLLAAVGRQSEALTVYEEITQRLADELGVDPGPDLRAAQQKVHRQHPSLAVARPAQLPSDLRTFSGREADLERMLVAAGSISVALIEGMAGVGKTTMAIRLAHELAPRFPDGQLFVNLRGFDPGGVTTAPEEALRHFLYALGVPGNRIPQRLDDMAALYRSLLRGKRILVVLDNARDGAQVMPLLPGSATCLTVVTSRNRLTSVIAQVGANPFILEPMPAEEARAMVAARLGDDRGELEPRAVDQIVTMCARLPLALAIIGARAAMHPGLPLSTIARELTGASASLDAFSRDGDAAVDLRAVFGASYRTLSADAARMFRLLALHWGPDVSVAASASMAGMTPSSTRDALSELTKTRLLTEHVPGRFEFHDLVRVYAMELSHEMDDPADRDAAVRRMVDHYLVSCTNMSTMAPLWPIADVFLTNTRVDGPETPTSTADATKWFATERHVLENVVKNALEVGFYEQAWRLALAMLLFFQSQGRFPSWVATLHAGLEAAKAAGDVAAEARTARGLAGGYHHAGDSENALRYLKLAADLIEDLGGTTEKAHILRNMGDVLSGLGHATSGDYPKAYAFYEKAAELYLELDEPRGLANARLGMGTCLYRMGAPERAFALQWEAIETCKVAQDIVGESVAWAQAADGRHEVGDYTTAVSYYGHAAEICRSTNHDMGLVRSLRGLGDAYAALGDRDSARAAWEEALSRTDDRFLSVEIQARLANPQ
ncbi:AfsR/SARP family transcriptional regulator [Kibdelosporangium aridum]|uniref:DNA-binding transcriptional activator of the SARP family n=1 Tax=Kibdelosporangium aridum TaxID=2030 RepID=A0A1W2EWT5_KIBAR|nr:BTAD domain-containing putative transcriptional regulator [Kibdelosporangium aridum]SMD14090.1 DNA-binding transcriptional activator of the SARP family [Kibdelosporangium aridum]